MSERNRIVIVEDTPMFLERIPMVVDELARRIGREFECVCINPTECHNAKHVVRSIMAEQEYMIGLLLDLALGCTQDGQSLYGTSVLNRVNQHNPRLIGERFGLMSTDPKTDAVIATCLSAGLPMPPAFMQKKEDARNPISRTALEAFLRDIPFEDINRTEFVVDSMQQRGQSLIEMPFELRDQ